MKKTRVSMSLSPSPSEASNPRQIEGEIVEQDDRLDPNFSPLDHATHLAIQSVIWPPDVPEQIKNMWFHQSLDFNLLDNKLPNLKHSSLPAKIPIITQPLNGPCGCICAFQAFTYRYLFYKPSELSPSSQTSQSITRPHSHPPPHELTGLTLLDEAKKGTLSTPPHPPPHHDDHASTPPHPPQHDDHVLTPHSPSPPPQHDDHVLSELSILDKARVRALACMLYRASIAPTYPDNLDNPDNPDNPERMIRFVYGISDELKHLRVINITINDSNNPNSPHDSITAEDTITYISNILIQHQKSNIW